MNITAMIVHGLAMPFKKLYWGLFFLFFIQNISLFAQPSGFVNQVESNGWNQIVGFTWDENGQQYVWEKGGKVWVVNINGNKLSNPLLDISEEVGNWRDFGMLGFALDPNFLTNGFFYVNYLVDRHHLFNFGTNNYSATTNEYFDASIGRVTRFQADINTNFTTLIPNSRFVLIGETKETGMPHLHESHGIGQITFGTDGTLLVAMGDGASYNSVDEGSASETYWQQALSDGIITAEENIGAYRCQILNSLNGKILRIDPMTGDGVPSNPFYQSGNPRSPQSRIWSTGVRNPYRMTKRPETGEHDPAEGNPGTFYFGDVGWGTWEDLNVISAPAQNFGWPKYEGIDYQPGYNNSTYAPTTHRRPKIDFRHGQDVARGWVNGQKVNVGSATLPGNPFRGNASTGGVWYTGDDFPPAYKNTYFHADYSLGWIRNFEFDENNNPLKVNEFANGIGPVVFLNTHPLDGGLYYVAYPDEIRKISYTGTFNKAPIANASAEILNQSAPVNVQFTGDQSFDPDFDALTYLWDFDDGTTSTEANPLHVFNPNNNNPTGYDVTLTVSDGNLTATKNLTITVNNSAPVIISTSIDNVNTYSVQNSTTLNLNASVADAEHSNNQLSYTWDIALHHNEHFHAEPTVTSSSTIATFSPIGCSGATYFYRIKLTVTDPVDAASVFVKDLYPDCSGSTQNISFQPITDKFITDSNFSLNANSSSGLPIYYYVTEGSATVTGNIVSLNGLPGQVTILATQPGDASTAAAIPVARTFQVLVPSGGNCSGSGTISREVWTDVSGVNVSQIPLNTPPDISDERNIFEIPVNTLDNFGTRMRGYICPPLTGQYTFWISSDDNGELYLSSNTDPANKTLIANVPTWSDSRQWNKFPEQQSAPVTLIAGQSYYIEALQKEQGGGDNLAVGWQLPNGNLQRPIPGSRLSPYAGQPPIASFSATPLTGNTPLNVNFDASNSNDPDGTITSYSWNFGDGQSGTGQNPTHTYNSVGDFTVTLTVTDNDGNTGSSSTVISTTETLQNQTITFNQIPDKLTTDGPFSLIANASSGLPVSFQIVSGSATVSGSTLTLNGMTGMVTVRASQAGNAIYNAAPDVERTFEVTMPNTGGDVDLALTLATDNNEPNIYSTFIVTATLTNTGTSTASNIIVDFPLPDGVVFVGGSESNASQGSYDLNNSREWMVGSLTAGSSATLELNFFLLTSDPVTSWCEVLSASGDDVDSTPNNGACCVVNEDDEAALTVPQAGPVDQTITFPNIPNKETTDVPFSLNATASSSLSVDYSVVSGPATISGNTVTLTGQTGTVTIEANQAGNANWNPAPPITQTFAVTAPGLMNQTIAFSPIPNKQTDSPNFSVFGTASSGLPVSFSIVSGPATLSGNTVSLTGQTGQVVVRASQSGNAQFNPAPDVDRSFNVSFPIGQGDMDLDLVMTTSNNNPSQWSNFTMTATLNNSGPNAATNVKVSFQKPDGVVFQGGNEFDASQGSYALNGNQIWNVGTINANESVTLALNFFVLTADPITAYAQVTDAMETDADSTPNNGSCCVANEDDEAALTVPQPSGPQPQTINFQTIADKETTDAPFSVSANATSGLPVSFVIESGPATISGSTITLDGTVGTVVVRASQAGNTDWNPAPDVTHSFNVNAPGAMNQTINFPSIPNKQISDAPFSISATATSNLPVSFEIASGPATISGNTITLDGTVGTVVVRASQAGNVDWNPAPDVTRSFNVSGPIGSDEIDIELSMTAANPNLQIWNNNTFTLTVENNGAVAATDVSINFPIPDGMAYTSSMTSTGSYDLFFQNWNVGTLDVGQSETMEFVLFVLQNTTPVDVFAQVVDASPTDTDSTPDNNNSTTPAEDDEVVVTVNPPGSPLVVLTDGEIPNIAYVKFQNVDNQQFERITVFPNPAKDILKIDLLNKVGLPVSIQIFDINGRLYYQEKLEGATANIHEIQIGEWAKGTYLVWIQLEGEMPLVQRFLKVD